MNKLKDRKSSCGSYYDLLHFKSESPVINLNKYSNLSDFSLNRIQSKVSYFDKPNFRESQTTLKSFINPRTSLSNVVSKVLFDNKDNFPKLINNQLGFESPKKSIFVIPPRRLSDHLRLINVGKSVRKYNVITPKSVQNDLFNEISLKNISLTSAIKLKNEYKDSLEFENESLYGTNDFIRFDIKINDKLYLYEVVDDFLFGTKARVYREYVELVDSLANSIKYSKSKLKELISIGFLHLTYVKQMLFMVGRRYNSYNSGDEENSYNTDLKMYALLNVKFSKKNITYLSHNEKNNIRTNKRLITRIYQ